MQPVRFQDVVTYVHWTQKIVNFTTGDTMSCHYVIMTTYGASNENKVVKSTPFVFSNMHVVTAEAEEASVILYVWIIIASSAVTTCICTCTLHAHTVTYVHVCHCMCTYICARTCARTCACVCLCRFFLCKCAYKHARSTVVVHIAM